MTKIEQVARAICNAGIYETGQGGCAAACMGQLGSSRGGPHGCPHAGRVHGRAARAAIEAMREPSAAMVRAWMKESGDVWVRDRRPLRVADGWQAMITTALEDE